MESNGKRIVDELRLQAALTATELAIERWTKLAYGIEAAEDRALRGHAVSMCVSLRDSLEHFARSANA